ncbi:MAG: CopG family transcriptional regulator [Gammaproteobacteria bacterium]|nr:CopG family transcriptional regulator [Gammaproteobacteria bacterium]
MRTTVAIDDDVLEAARKLASARDQSLGKVVSDLMRRGLAIRAEYPAGERGFPTFEVREDSPPITLEDVKRDEDEAD